MRTLVLYDAIKEYIKNFDEDYQISQGFIDYEREYSLGIYVQDITPKYKFFNGHKYQGRNARLQFVVMGGSSDSDYFKNRVLCEKLEGLSDILQNVTLTTSQRYYKDQNDDIQYSATIGQHQGIEIFISNSNLLNGTVDAGKSPDGHPMFSITFLVTYFIGGNKQ